MLSLILEVRSSLPEEMSPEQKRQLKEMLVKTAKAALKKEDIGFAFHVALFEQLI